LIISLIVAVISAFSMAVGLFFSRFSLDAAIGGELRVISKIADDLISAELDLWKSEADSVAERMLRLGKGESEASLLAQIRLRGFLSAAIFRKDGTFVSFGDYEPDVSFINSDDMRRAFQGESVVSSTGYDSNGVFVLRVCVPMEDGNVLVGVLPGLELSSIVDGLFIWNSGHIMILDSEGTVIGDWDHELVRMRANFIHMAESDPQYSGIAEIHKRMVRGEMGIGVYSYKGTPRDCYFMPVSASLNGWSMGVISPSGESPATQMQYVQIFSALLFLFLGLLAAISASRVISRPFQQVREQNLRLATLSETKSNFLANMSHEMRTPLNAIIGFSELTLDDAALAGPVRENIAKVYGAGMTLLGIINDILDISKIESGKFEIRPVVYDLAALISDTVSLNIMRMGSKPLRFSLHVDESLPAKLFGDDLRIKQIYNNILSNAFKYTHEGNIDWSVRCEREGEKIWLVSSVMDTGIGIHPEDMDGLFSEYVRLDAQSNRKVEGTGLGLSITKKLAEMMHGGITVESEHGAGSVFTVRLLQGFVDDRVIGAEAAAGLRDFRYMEKKQRRSRRLTRRNMSYARVLVVDDVPSNLEVARGMLKPYGLTVDCVESGQQAVDLLRAETPRYNAVFMDHMMPEMNGIEAVRIIREVIDSPYTRSVPIIALTANAVVGNEEMFLQHGFQDFISKPIDILRLDTVLERWVRNREAEKDLVIAPAAAPPPQDPANAGLLCGRLVEGLDLLRGLERFGQDEAAYLRVLRSYALHTSTLLDELRGPSAENLPAYTIAIHGIKGSSYSICADTAGKKAEELEHAARAGNLDFVLEQGKEFLRLEEKLLADISAMLAELDASAGKTQKIMPESEQLREMLHAAATFDMSSMDRIMDELDAYTYAGGAELVDWLRDQILMSNFRQIQERLEKELESR
jgi:signal transduction histidine kinase/DNA-binding NarL/FixJ family response regulator